MSCFSKNTIISLGLFIDLTLGSIYSIDLILRPFESIDSINQMIGLVCGSIRHSTCFWNLPGTCTIIALLGREYANIFATTLPLNLGSPIQRMR